jgi:hypothetical protein
MGMNQQFLQNEDITSEDLMGKKTLWDPQSMYIYTHRHGLSDSCAPKKHINTFKAISTQSRNFVTQNGFIPAI